MGEKLVTIAVAITGVATLALLVSKRANTAGVIGAAGKAFSQSLAVAVSPVTGGGGIGNNLSGFQPSF
jgi:hypothetical protein